MAINPGRGMNYHTDPQKGYLLFQQAIMDGRTEAWEEIYHLYSPLVRKWVNRHPNFANTGEDADYFANRAFEKMWRALPREKFAKFPDLKALLAYLQMCVNSVIVDHLRAEKLYGLALDGVEEHLSLPTASIEDELWQAMQRQQLWAIIHKRLKNDTEYQLIYYRFVLGLKPSDICTLFGDTFSDVRQVYTLTQNILARLRRDPKLVAYRINLEPIDALRILER